MSPTNDDAIEHESNEPSFTLDDDNVGNVEPGDDVNSQMSAKTHQSSCSSTVLPLQTAPKINKKPKGKNSVIDLLKRRAEDQCSLAKVIEKLVTQEENTKEEDEIEVFMRSMTLTIKKLTPAEQSEAKRKIFNVVNEIEERHHSRAHTLNTFNYSRTPSTLSYESSVSDAVLLDEFNAFT